MKMMNEEDITLGLQKFDFRNFISRKGLKLTVSMKDRKGDGHTGSDVDCNINP